MASAIADSVAPRNPSSDDVEQLKELIVSGLKGPAVKGTTLQFDCRSGEGVDVTVDGRAQGSVDSATLAEAFCNVFLDDKTVSPALRASILDNCCAE
jgi:Chalcone isomerase-like